MATYLATTSKTLQKLYKNFAILRNFWIFCPIFGHLAHLIFAGGHTFLATILGVFAILLGVFSDFGQMATFFFKILNF
jgi:hypothetical protein